jgi:hypothetical protein
MDIGYSPRPENATKAIYTHDQIYRRYQTAPVSRRASMAFPITIRPFGKSSAFRPSPLALAMGVDEDTRLPSAAQRPTTGAATCSGVDQRRSAPQRSSFMSPWHCICHEKVNPHLYFGFQKLGCPIRGVEGGNYIITIRKVRVEM